MWFRLSRRYFWLPCITSLLLGTLSCGEDESAKPSASDLGNSAGSAGTAGTAGQMDTPWCEVEITQHPLAPTVHVDECSPLSDENFTSNPPSSGNHYPRWAAYKSYDAPIPRGYSVHCMEHGAVILLYNCPEGCPEDVAALQKILDQLPEDPICTDPEGPRHRTLLLPDPHIPSRFAASSWGWTLQAPCVDPPSFTAFIHDHYGKGTEDECKDGIDPITEGISANCGE